MSKVIKIDLNLKSRDYDSFDEKPHQAVSISGRTWQRKVSTLITEHLHLDRPVLKSTDLDGTMAGLEGQFNPSPFSDHQTIGHVCPAFFFFLTKRAGSLS